MPSTFLPGVLQRWQDYWSDRGIPRAQVKQLFLVSLSFLLHWPFTAGLSSPEHRLHRTLEMLTASTGKKLPPRQWRQEFSPPKFYSPNLSTHSVRSPNQRTHGKLHPVAWPGSISLESKRLPTLGGWGGLDEKWPLTGLGVWTLGSQLVLFRRCDLGKEVCPQGRLWEPCSTSSLLCSLYFTKTVVEAVIFLLPAPTTMFAPCCHASTLWWMKVYGTVSQNKLFLKSSLFMMLYHCDWTAANTVA